MIYLYFFLPAYIFTGIGFSVASWLQAAEIEVNETGSYGSFFSTTALWFVFGWPVFAFYCYKRDVKKQISDEVHNKIFADKK